MRLNKFIQFLEKNNSNVINLKTNKPVNINGFKILFEFVSEIIEFETETGDIIKFTIKNFKRYCKFGEGKYFLPTLITKLRRGFDFNVEHPKILTYIKNNKELYFLYLKFKRGEIKKEDLFLTVLEHILEAEAIGTVYQICCIDFGNLNLK